MSIFKTGGPEVIILPRTIKKEIILGYVFRDLFYNNRMMLCLKREHELLYEMSVGFMPRLFRHDDADDRIICDQDDEVGELYYMKDCKVGVAVNTLGNTQNQS